jgi:hypothetical protein
MYRGEITSLLQTRAHPYPDSQKSQLKIFICGQRVYVFEPNTDLEVTSVRSRQTLCERRGVATVALEIRIAFESTGVYVDIRLVVVYVSLCV